MTVPGSFVIGDDTPQSVITPSHVSRGLQPRIYSSVPYGEAGFTKFADAFPQGIPRADWPDRIAAAESARSMPYHIWQDRLNGLVLDQDGLPFCHGFSAVLGLMIQRAAAGLPFVELSGSGVAAPTVGWRSAGAWIMDDLKTMMRLGAPSVEFVPQLQVKKSGFRDGWEADAATRKVTEVYELRGRDFDETATALLLGFSICTGINWWGHATVDCRLVDSGKGSASSVSRYRPGGINSWGYGYGDRGYFERSGSKMFNDEQYAVRVSVAA